MDQTTLTRIYKPLNELKYTYKPHSKSTTIEAVASTELPTIQTKLARRNDYSTRSYTYANTTNQILKMKLECGHIYDQISLIDLHMEEDEALYQQALRNHERFTKAFTQFLNRRYSRVTKALSELADHEQKSTQTKTILDQLERQVVHNSLRIYALERTWRKYKVSQNFLLYLASLLKRENLISHFENFNIDPVCDTPSLDELVHNFEKHDSERPFNADHFLHITAERVTDYLRKLKKQNLRLLDLKLRYQDMKEDLVEDELRVQQEYEQKESAMAADINETRNKINDTANEIGLARTQLQAAGQRLHCKSKHVNDLQKCIEALYERCFDCIGIKGSHLQMMKCVEQHCVTLLNELSTIDMQTLKKVIA